jgi:hypothetical protein
MPREALRYLQNAKEILRKAPREDDYYRDVKYVREACGTAYLAVLNAIDEHLLEKGWSKKDLPKSVDAYRKALQKHLAVRNGRLTREFENLYDELHIAGYYRGFLHRVGVVKDAFKGAEEFIAKLRG